MGTRLEEKQLPPSCPGIGRDLSVWTGSTDRRFHPRSENPNEKIAALVTQGLARVDSEPIAPPPPSPHPEQINPLRNGEDRGGISGERRRPAIREK